MNHLISLGHEKIAFLGGFVNHISIKQRYDAYKNAMNSHLSNVKPIFIEADILSVDHGYEAIMNYKGEKFTALFAANDKNCYWCYQSI